ncbi:Uncharacterized protein BM_BM17845 [Brugia malayi]|uniref:C2H2-type domain-containing protein n=1 Tax=Brugia malayi TaxID=6279 RepID=A0A4E9FUN0_BRUMA|nr:Uncharacterized protein BM_BM17845 [Brugia malayi]VIO99551.1 Uncharacterized protein BM_BM17845 [Brugia malayi]
MHFIYYFCFFFQLINIQTTAAQTDQTEPLDLSISKVKEKGDGSQGLSMEAVSDEGIKPLLRLVPIESLMEEIELSKQKERRKKQRCDICRKEAAQTDQTEPLDLSISKVKEKGDGSQGLSMEAVSDEGIKPLLRLVPIESLMEEIELSKQKERRKKQRCDICRKEVTYMKTHMMTHTGEKPYSCPICKKNFTQSQSMKAHMMIHTGQKPYSCSICKKNFSLPAHMKGHMITHTGEKPYSCPTCKKFFNNFSNMKKHMMTHTGEKPYSCPICKKNFSRSSHVKGHMITHTGEKSYSCPICKKNFSRSSHVKGHMITHTGEKPHSCPVCGKSYVRKSDLHIHTAIHGMNSRPVYHCTICNKDFQRKLGLKLHMKKH